MNLLNQLLSLFIGILLLPLAFCIIIFPWLELYSRGQGASLRYPQLLFAYFQLQYIISKVKIVQENRV